MKNSLLIAAREWRARMGSRSFIAFMIAGPIIVLAIVYALFVLGGQSNQRWNVLITDPSGIMKNKIPVGDNQSITYSFADDYLEHFDFRDGKQFQEFDAMVEVNGKILSNKTCKVFYREAPMVRMQSRIQYQVERRLEEILVDQFTDFSIADYRKIKQPLSVSFHDVNDPHNEREDLNAWAGLFFGALIFVFIFLFGMTILRSVSREKSNRIVEVLLASVSPNQLMTGKILGIGLSALVQFLTWIIIIGLGLYFMRENIFQDMLDASNMNITELAMEGSGESYEEGVLAAREYNEFVNLVYDRIRFGNILAFFLMFFIAGYIFYGALFAAIGATMGSESDGQQFVIPLILLLCLSLYSGYYYLNYPESTTATILHYLPFTAPVVVMVKLLMGYEPGHAYEIYLALIILLISSLVVMRIAARLYKNGILQFGHRLRLKHLFKWLGKA